VTCIWEVSIFVLTGIWYILTCICRVPVKNCWLIHLCICSGLRTSEWFSETFSLSELLKNYCHISIFRQMWNFNFYFIPEPTHVSAHMNMHIPAWNACTFPVTCAIIVMQWTHFLTCLVVFWVFPGSYHSELDHDYSLLCIMIIPSDTQ